LEFKKFLTQKCFLSSRQKVEVVENEVEMLRQYNNLTGGDTWDFVGLEFVSFTPKLEYRLRCNRKILPPTNAVYTENVFSSPGYGYSSVLAVQILVNSWAAEISPNAISVNSFPQLPGKLDIVLQIAKVLDFMAIIFVSHSSCSFLTLYLKLSLGAVNMAQSIVMEKENKLREGLRMLGLYEASYWASWLLFYSLFAAITTIVSTVSAVKIFPNSDTFMFFLVVFFFQVSLLGLALLIASFSSKSRYAGVILNLIILGSYAAGKFAGEWNAPRSFLNLISLLSPYPFFTCFNRFVQYEGKGLGFSWKDAGEDLTAPSFSFSLGMLVIDSLLYFILAGYFDRVMPSEFGVRLPWYFPFTLRFWKQAFSRVSYEELIEESRLSVHHEQHNIAQLNDLPSKFVQDDMKAIDDVKVSIRKLTKVFSTGSGTFKAVDSVSLNMLEGEIFSLLGRG